MQRWWRGAAVGAIGLSLLAGCGYDWGLRTVRTDQPLPADRVVFNVSVSSQAPLPAAFQVASVRVMGSGEVYTATMSWDRPPRIRVGRADPLTVAGLAAAVEVDGVLDADDLGRVRGSDADSTSVLVHGYGERRGVSVPGLGEPLADGITDDQVDRRDKIAALVDALPELAGDTTDWTPMAVRAVLVEIGAAPGGGPPWPGPPVAGSGLADADLRCVTVTVDAPALYARALDNPGALWTTDVGPAVIAVTPVLPGDTPC